MADEYLFYEEDYDGISDWDEEESDENNNTNNNNTITPTKEATTKPNKTITKQDESEEKKISNGMRITSPTALSITYIPKSTSSSFIVHKYGVFTSKEMKQQINNLLQELSLTLNLDIEIVSLLLRRYEWKTERLMENYLRNSLACLHEHNLHLIHQKNDSKLLSNNDLMIECSICVNDVKISSTLSLDCNHRFCNECWSDYISCTINNKSFNSIFITCPGHKCKTPLKNSLIKKFAMDKAQWSKYENYIIQSYITSNSHKYRFCPAPGCNYIIYCNDTSPKSLINDSPTRLNPTRTRVSPIRHKNKNTKKYKSKYKQKQQQQKLANANANANSINSTPNSKSENKNLKPTKKYEKLPAELQGFQFFGQNNNNNNNNSNSSAKSKSKNSKSKKPKAKQKTVLLNNEYHNVVETVNMISNNDKSIAKQPTTTGHGHTLGSQYASNAQEAVFVQCKCGFDLCFLCLEEYHAPATCQQVENWNFKCLKESENAQWIVTNTKKCPKCFTRIERNHGCNHMVCTKCQYEFCWVCMGSWKQHGIGTGGYYRCNKYKPKASMGNKQKLQQSQDEELDKFVHYFNRFHNHAQSRQFLIESSHKVLRKIKSHLNIKSHNKSWIDVEFLKNAHDEIFFCRQILKYTYVYAYYLKTGAEKDLFEFLQQDLEKNCEILHELCEQNWKNINATFIINYTNITHRFVKQLLHGIANGLMR